MVKKKVDKCVWRLIDEDDYAELEPIRFGDENDSDNGGPIMLPTDYPLDFDLPDSIMSAKEFFDYYLTTFFVLLFKPTSDALFKNGYRILKDLDELRLFWQTEMLLDLHIPKRKAYREFWPTLKKIAKIPIIALYRFKEIRASIRSYDEDTYNGRPYRKVQPITKV